VNVAGLQAHMLLLCYHSEFFRTALAARPDFKEGKSKHVELGFEDPAGNKLRSAAD
jgi:hypothetical protein